MPLYNEEIYFVARADSQLNFVHEISDAAHQRRASCGSGTALTTSTLYRQMFGDAMPEARTTFLNNEDALVKLIGDKSVDVVVDRCRPAGQAPRRHEARGEAAHQAAQGGSGKCRNAAPRCSTYFPATVRAASYPNLLTEDVPAVAVRAFLVTYDYDTSTKRGRRSRGLRSRCARTLRRCRRRAIRSGARSS